MQFSGKMRVWFSYPQGQSMNDLAEKIKTGNLQDAIGYVTLSCADMSNLGWVEVGHADVTVTLASTDAITAKQIEALNEQLRQHRVNAQLAERAILDRISKLQALTMEAV